MPKSRSTPGDDDGRLGTLKRAATVGAGLTVGALVAASVWGRRQRDDAETVPYTVVARLGEVELRRYPRVVTVETTADSENEAFGRLFRYIAGANEGSNDISMTTPVEIRPRGASIRMTTPVEVDLGSRLPERDDGDEDRRRDEGVRMAFYLPADYGPETAPVPTDDRVELVTVPERTLAVRQFSWRPTTARITRERDALLSTLADADVATVGEPFFMGYDAPWTLPFTRRNEVAVEVEN
ncbi:heme-binding protein [Halolamina litorea]|uniref:SOUL family heme-binding protein n=1 Tax=Halolamina litorea TaxID=1515593 RepID=A0ABD6BU68_9EURY|nr:heme-binding protein [Halolamina litorea]